MGDKEVYARQAAAAECGVNADSVPTDGRKLLLGDMCRNVQTRAFVLVLGIKGVELLRRSDFADRRGLRLEVAEHSALDLVTVDELLDEHLGIQLKCFGQALGQLEQIVRLGNAHGRALRARLDEYRERAQRFRSRGDNRLGIALKVISQRQIVPRLTDTGALNDLFGQCLIHRVRACSYAAADVRNAGQFEQTLHRAVLAADAVQHREYAVQTDNLDFSLTEQHHAMHAAVGCENDLDLAGHALPRTALYAVRITVRAVEPLAAAGDADRIDFIFIFIQVSQNRSGRQARDVVLTRNTAE